MSTGRAFLVVVAAALVSCAYAEDRGRDVLDVVDFEYGTGGKGVALDVQATEFFGTGIGLDPDYETTEFYGRRKVEHSGTYVGIGLLSMEFRPGCGAGEVTAAGFRLSWPFPQYVSFLRTGLTVGVPGARGGIYVNPGEIVDLVLGLATIDLADDDGLPPGAPYHRRASEWREVEPPDEEAGPSDG